MASRIGVTASLRCAGYFAPLVVFFGVNLLVLTLSRVALMLWQYERVDAANAWAGVLWAGLRVDVSSLSYLLIPAVFMLLFGALLPELRRRVLNAWLVIASVTLLVMEVITPTFISEYDLRPNRLLVEYLMYPREVFSMLWTGYKLDIACVSLALVASVWGYQVLFGRLIPATEKKVYWRTYPLAVVMLCCLVLGARGSIGHRPLNPAMVSFSNDHLINGLALNSSYSAAFALKQMGLELSAQALYGAMPQEEVLRLVNQSMQGTPQGAPGVPTARYRQASYQGKPKNIVILLQESLGARYVGGLGGLPLTPNLDRLMQQGWSFTQLYATGTRSVRGIEAVLTGFVPTPSRAVVKLDKSQRDFFTLASFLQQQGYFTQFIYGGEAHFDNMKSFFLGNGVEDIVDSSRFEQIGFEGSWGASDEDLYAQADREFTRLAETEQPFFSLVFTSSNHSPYEYPKGKIAPYNQPDATRENAAKYADYALGQFMTKARASNYWQDTLFLVVADHDSRVAGASLVPVEHFRIPGVIVGQGIEQRKDARLVSQIDLAPTLLSLAGVSGTTPMPGHDLTLTLPPEKQRALMQYDKNFAYMTPQELVVLQPGKQAMKLDNAGVTPASKFSADRARAHVLFGSLAYHHHWYKLAEQQSATSMSRSEASD